MREVAVWNRRERVWRTGFCRRESGDGFLWVGFGGKKGGDDLWWAGFGGKEVGVCRRREEREGLVAAGGRWWAGGVPLTCIILYRSVAYPFCPCILLHGNMHY